MTFQVRLLTQLVCLFMLFLEATNAHAVSVHNEAIDGDLSGNRLIPTHLMLTAGINSLSATTGAEIIDDELVLDQEYVRIDLPANHQLSNIRMQAYSSFDGTAFIGVQSGATFSFDPDDAIANIGSLLGYVHFGPNEGHNIGDDILPGIGLAGGAIGFTPPLTGSSYTFWLQQTGSLTSYQLDFIVTAVPEPAAWISMITALAIVILARKSKAAAQRIG